MEKSLIGFRSRAALKKITANIKEKNELLTELILNPINKDMVGFFSSQEEPFTIRKRLVQEQCAHFVLRHFAKNNKVPGNSSFIKVMGLAGQNPWLAIASYLRRGLITNADLFELDNEVYEKWTKTKEEKRKSISPFGEMLDTTFWAAGDYKKEITIINQNYLDYKTNKKYQGFLLDHCGIMPESNIVADYIDRRTDCYPFFVEATMMDGRGSIPNNWSREFEDELYNKNIFMLAKDSFEYKGGTENTQHGLPMKTFVWIFEKEKIIEQENPDKIILGF